MQDKRSAPPQQQPAKKGYQTAISVLSNILFMMCLLSLLAWFLLMIFFGVALVFKNGFVISRQIHAIAQSNLHYIKTNATPCFGQLLEWLDHAENIMQQAINAPLEHGTQLMQKVHYKEHISSEQASSTFSAMLFGTIEIILGRFLVFVVSLPFLLGTLLVMSVDGLMQRDLRKFQAERESTFFFHRVKPLISKAFILLFLLYMSLPLTFQPTLFLVPMAFILSVMAMIAIKSYKKYV